MSFKLLEGSRILEMPTKNAVVRAVDLRIRETRGHPDKFWQVPRPIITYH